MRNFPRCHAQWHITLPKSVAELHRLALLPSLNLQTCLPWPVHRLRMQSPGEFGDGVVLGDVAIHAFPYSFFSYPNLTWMDGDSCGCGPGLLGSLLGKCFKPEESLPEPLRGTGCWQGCKQAACANWSGEDSVPAESSFLSGLDSCGVPLNQPSYTWISPRSHFFNMRK